jgi:hypothetical protein
MVIKIPRGKQPEITLPQTGALNVSAMNVISPVMNRLGGFLDSVSKEKQANDLRLENQRILNKVTKNKSLLADIGAEWIQKEVIEHPDVLTKENYDSLYKKFVKDQEKWMGIQFKNDPKALEMFESEFYEVMTDVRGNIDHEKNQRILADSQISYDTHRQEVNDWITKLPSDDNIWLAREMLIKKEQNKFLESADAGLVIDLPERIAWLNFEIWKKAVSGEKERISLATGKKVVDYEGVFQELNETGKNKKTEWYGEPITEEIRARLLTWSREKANQQNTIEDKAVIRINNESYMKNIDGILQGNVTIDDLREENFIGINGEELRNALIGLVQRRQVGQIVTDSKLNVYNYVYTEILSNKITSMSQKFYIPSIGETPDEAQSIIDRWGTDISDEDALRYYALLENKKNANTSKEASDFVLHRKEFDEFSKAYELLIKGKLRKYNLMSDSRFYKVKKMLEVRYYEQLAKGKTYQELLWNDDGEHFIFKDVENYILTLQEQTQEMMESLKLNTTLEDRQHFFPPQKKFGQTYDGWKKSKEYLDWLNSENFILYREYLEKNKK